MDNNILGRIRVLITSLPKSDVPLGQKYLQERDFESLQYLINSALIRVRRGLLKENPKKEYLDTNIIRLRKLKVEVDTYCTSLDIDNVEQDEELLYS